MRTLRTFLFALAPLLAAPALHAGTFSTAAWTDDASTYIANGPTVWAYHFGTTTAATVNGVSVLGLAGGASPVSAAGKFSITGLASVFNNDTNFLSLLNGSGTPVMASDFIYGGNPGTVQIQGLTAGNHYTVSVFGVGFEAAGGRQVTFASGSDSLLVDEDQFGNNLGIRVDYSFTATAATQTITLTPQPSGATWHLYAMALRSETTASLLTVSNTPDSGGGSLRWALANAATLPGADTITFAPALSGKTITLSSEIVLNMDNVGDVTVDATSLPGGVTINGGPGTNQIFSITKTGATFGTVTLAGLTLTGGNGTGNAPGNNGYGGAIFNNGGTLTLTLCTLSGNTAASFGGAIYNAGLLTLTQSTLSGNAAPQGGAIFNNGGTLTLTHCTLSGNTASSAGGAISNTGALTLRNSIAAGNPSGNNTDLFIPAGTVTRVGTSIVQSYGGIAATGSGTFLTADPLLAPLANHVGPTQTMPLLPGSPALDGVPAGDIVPGLATDQRGLPRNRDGDAVAGALPDIGAYEAQVAPVGSLGFNFNGDSPRNLAATDRAGAPEFAQTHWNNLSSAFGFATTPRSTAGGGSVSVSTEWRAPNVYIVPGAPTTPDEKIMRGYLDSNEAANSGSNLYDGQNQPFFALADLPASFTFGGYRVVVYADTDTTANRVGEYWLTTHSGNPGDVSGTTDLTPHLFLKDTADFSGTYTRVPATSTTSAGAASGNFLVLENQTLPGFILRADEAGGTQPRTVLNAVQVVRNELLVVTTAADENDPPGTVGTGLSLREAVALAPDGAGIVFDSALSGQTLTLSAALKDITLTKSVTINASNLPGGITLSGGGTSRLFSVNSGQSLTLRGLTLTGGNGTGNNGFSNGAGGAIYSTVGTLTLTQCTLYGNSANRGGAIYSSTTSIGGSITSSTTLTQCTLAGNTATTNGGAIRNQNGRTTLTHCTVSGNTAPAGNGSGVASFGDNFTETVVRYCLIAGNTNSDVDFGADVTNSFTSQGGNLIGTGNATTSPNDFNQSGDTTGHTAATALLAALGNYGGPTQTMLPLAGSPAINAAVGSTITTDQRGFTIVGVPDIGAAEYHPSTTVAVTADSGAGSLRQAIANAALIPGPNAITFDAALSGQTISLASEIVLASDVTLDATSLPGGLTINDGTATTYRFFTVNSGQTVELRGLTLANGGGTGLGDAGAILNQGNLTLTRCTVTGCRSINDAGALLNTATGALTLMQCTLFGNQTANAGGAIRNQGTLSLTHCTVSSNTGGQGGGIHNSGPLTLAHSIVAGNSASGADKDILNTGASAVLTKTGASLVTNLVHSSGGSETGSGTLSNAAPGLAALGSYGGPTQTMPPLVGSPAINAALGSPITADQRGFPIVSVPDLGAAEYFSTVVTVTVDSGLGSLRQAIADAAALPGPDTITFAPALSGQTITLASEIVMDMTNVGNVTVDATSLPAGVTINGGPGTNRIFSITNTGATFGTVTLAGLTLTGGNGTGASLSQYGGAILNLGGTLALTQCTLSSNSATFGGAIYYSFGTLALTQCTLSGNTATNGGAIYNDGTLTLTQCTLSGNTATNGGAIYNQRTLTLNNSIVAGNTAPNGGDIRNFDSGPDPTYARLRANVVQSVSNIGTVNESGPTAITSAPLLAPLGNYGGPTQTMALLPGSPARNAAAGSTITTDQRGFPIVGTADIGAYEAGTFSNYNAWIYETLPATATTPQRAGTFDFDGDGQTNDAEWTALTDPGSATSRFTATPVRNGANLEITVPTATGRTYTLLQSDTLLGGSWMPTPGLTPQPGTGSSLTFQIPISGTRKFYQVQVLAP